MRDLQPLLSLPFTPSTYHVLLASAAGARARDRAINKSLMGLGLIKISVGFAGYVGKLKSGRVVQPANIWKRAQNPTLKVARDFGLRPQLCQQERNCG
jgi:hypothetical protein